MQAVKMRGLKKADFEVDFFFMDEVELFQSAMKRKAMLESWVKYKKNVNDILLYLRVFWNLATVLSRRS